MNRWDDLSQQLSDAQAQTNSSGLPPTFAPAPFISASAMSQIQFTPHLAGVNPPTHLYLDGNNKTETWLLWKQHWTNYIPLSNIRLLDDTFQFEMFENCLGPTALKMYDQPNFTRMVKDIAIVLKQIEHVIIGDLNETYERYVFNFRSETS